jgi:hypothetical protein
VAGAAPVVGDRAERKEEVTRRIGMFVVILALIATCAATKQPETLEQLKARADATTGEEKPVVCADVVQREIEAADKSFTDGEAEKGHAMVHDAVAYAEKARDASKGLPAKKMKKIEIMLRQAENRMNALRRTLALEDQQDVQEAAEKIAKIRTEILDQMFAPKHK